MICKEPRLRGGSRFRASGYGGLRTWTPKVQSMKMIVLWLVSRIVGHDFPYFCGPGQAYEVCSGVWGLMADLKTKAF